MNTFLTQTVISALLHFSIRRQHWNDKCAALTGPHIPPDGCWTRRCWKSSHILKLFMQKCYSAMRTLMPLPPPMHFHFSDSILSTIILLPTLFLPCSHFRDKCVNIYARWSFPALPCILKVGKCQHTLHRSVLSRAANNTTGMGPAVKTLMD